MAISWLSHAVTYGMTKRRLERSDTPIEKLAWQVGYEDPAFFRRLFRRVTGLSPGAYRKRFQIPGFARR